jgi:hypothetical protein
MVTGVFNDHALELGVFKRHRGRFGAVSEGDLFVGKSREEVEALAKEKHPGDVPHIRYIRRRKVFRIYAGPPHSYDVKPVDRKSRISTPGQLFPS